MTREELGHLDKNQWQSDDRGIPQDPWRPSDRLVMRTMDSSADLLTFISSSVGGRNAIAKLLGKVASSGPGQQGEMPVVVLETGSYDHDSFGVVQFPSFRITDWAYWSPEDGPQAASPKDWKEEIGDEVPF